MSYSEEYHEAMKQVDVMISPNSASDIPSANDLRTGKLDAIVGEYSQDYYTTPSNLWGAPAIWMPRKDIKSKVYS